MLQWTQGCMYLFELVPLFSLGKYLQAAAYICSFKLWALWHMLSHPDPHYTLQPTGQAALCISKGKSSNAWRNKMSCPRLTVSDMLRLAAGGPQSFFTLGLSGEGSTNGFRGHGLPKNGCPLLEHLENQGGWMNLEPDTGSRSPGCRSGYWPAWSWQIPPLLPPQVSHLLIREELNRRSLR